MAEDVRSPTRLAAGLAQLPGPRGAAAFLLPAALVGALAAADGGYFAPARQWALAAVGFAAVAALLGRERILLGRRELAAVALLGALVAWTALSALWADVASTAWPEAERTLLYALGLLAALLVVERRTLVPFLAGVLVGAVVPLSWGLAAFLRAERVLDPVQGPLLFRPLGYANAVGLLAAIGIVLGLGLARSGGRRPATAGLGAVAVLVLVCALYLSTSRAAMAALCAGILAAVLLDRLDGIATARLLIAAAPAAVALALVAGGGLLDTALAQEEFAARAGRVAALLAVLVLLAVPAGAAAAHLRIHVPRLVTALVVALGLAAGGLAVAVSPYRLLGLGDRPAYWRVARDAWREQPLLGIGAGGFEARWLEHRTIDAAVRDAHSLYLETLAELGLPGLALLLAALALPLAAAWTARRHPLVPWATGAYLVFCLHAGVDWDWEMPAVTLAGLLCGAGLLAAGRGRGSPARELGVRARLVVAAAALAAALLALVRVAL